MILELETQHEPGFDEAWLRLLQSAADTAEKAEGLHTPAAIHILITNDQEIHTLNREQRGIDRATDVLSFPTVPYPAGIRAGAVPELLEQEYDPDEGAVYLGDIVISMDHVRAQAAEYGPSVERELCYLMVHGIFHLFGYDHMEEEERREMRAMEEKTLNEINVKAYDRDELIARAKEAMKYSYSPYSHYPVGACLLAKSGKMYTGCNIENASYGVANCAERTALFKAVSEGEREFVAIAVTTEKFLGWPCGICRQALYEFAPDLEVIVACGDEVDSMPLRELLPHGFGAAPDRLGKE